MQRNCAIGLSATTLSSAVRLGSTNANSPKRRIATCLMMTQRDCIMPVQDGISQRAGEQEAGQVRQRNARYDVKLSAAVKTDCVTTTADGT